MGSEVQNSELVRSWLRLGSRIINAEIRHVPRQNFEVLRDAVRVKLADELLDTEAAHERMAEHENLRNGYCDVKMRFDEITMFGSNRGEYETELVEHRARLRAIT